MRYHCPDPSVRKREVPQYVGCRGARHGQSALYVHGNYGYLTENKPTAVRDLVYQLCMSTANIALDRNGNPYSPRKQGAGIADIEKATKTSAYLYVDGIGKTKLELGDDPRREGVYTMKINLKNISDQAVSYRLGNITMTESVSTSEPEFEAEMAFMLSIPVIRAKDEEEIEKYKVGENLKKVKLYSSGQYLEIYSITDHAILKPSNVAVPLPTSSSNIKLLDVAF